MDLFLVTELSRSNNLEKRTTVFQAARLLPCHCRLAFKLFPRYLYNSLDTFASKFKFLA